MGGIEQVVTHQREGPEAMDDLSADAKSSVQGLSLRKNFSWTFAANVVYGASQWAMIIVLARMGSAEMVGEFALALAFVTPIMALANLQLRSIQATDARGEYVFADYLGLRIVTTLLGGGVIIGAAMIVGYESWTLWVIIAMGCAKSVENLSDVFYGLQQQNERMDSVATSKLVRGPLSLIGLAAAVWVFQNVVWGILGMAFARLLVLICIDIPLGRKRASEQVAIEGIMGENDKYSLFPTFTGSTLCRLGRLAFPMGLVTMLVSLSASVPRLVLEGVVDVHALGVFTAVAALMAAGDQVNMALGQSAAPRLARYYASASHTRYAFLLVRLVGFGVMLGAIGIAGAWLLGSQVLGLVYSQEYAAYDDVLLVVMIAATLAYVSSYLGYGMTALRQFWAQTWLSVIATLITIGSSLYLIPNYGIMGAAWTVVISFAAQVPLKIAVVVLTLYHKRHSQE